MRDWKVENLANVKELYTVPIATEKRGSLQFLNRFSVKLGCLPFSRQNNPQILVESEMERKFLGKFRSEIVDYLQR